MTAEMGKPVPRPAPRSRKSATACDYYAEDGPRQPRWTVDTGNQRSWKSFEPLGVVLEMSCPGTYWQVLRFAAPTLLAGNTAILSIPKRHRLRLAIEKVFGEAGLAADVFGPSSWQKPTSTTSPRYCRAHQRR